MKVSIESYDGYIAVIKINDKKIELHCPVSLWDQAKLEVEKAFGLKSTVYLDRSQLEIIAGRIRKEFDGRIVEPKIKEAGNKDKVAVEKPRRARKSAKKTD